MDVGLGPRAKALMRTMVAGYLAQRGSVREEELAHFILGVIEELRKRGYEASPEDSLVILDLVEMRDGEVTLSEAGKEYLRVTNRLPALEHPKENQGPRPSWTRWQRP